MKHTREQDDPEGGTMLWTLTQDMLHTHATFKHTQGKYDSAGSVSACMRAKFSLTNRSMHQRREQRKRRHDNERKDTFSHLKHARGFIDASASTIPLRIWFFFIFLRAKVAVWPVSNLCQLRFDLCQTCVNSKSDLCQSCVCCNWPVSKLCELKFDLDQTYVSRNSIRIAALTPISQDHTHQEEMRPKWP